VADRQRHTLGVRKVCKLLVAAIVSSLLTVPPGVARATTPGGGFVHDPSVYDVKTAGATVIGTGDLNHDDQTDVVTSGFNFLNVLLMGSDGTLHPDTVAPPHTGGNSAVAIGRLTLDLNPDVVVLDGPHALQIFPGDGTGGFGGPVTTLEYSDLFPNAINPPVSDPKVMQLALGDLNDDGIDDVVVTNFYNREVAVLLNDGLGGLAPTTLSPYPVGVYPGQAGIADFNGDSLADIAVVSEFGAPGLDDGAVTVYLGTALGTFVPAPGSPYDTGLIEPGRLVIGDVSGDGRPDVLAGSSYTAPMSVSVMLGGPLGLVMAPGSPIAVDPSGGGPMTIGYDANLGQAFLAVASEYSRTLTVMVADRLGQLSPAPGSPYVIDGYAGQPRYFFSSAGVGSLDGRPFVAMQSADAATGSFSGPLEVMVDELIPQPQMTVGATANPAAPGPTTFTARIRYAKAGWVTFSADGHAIDACGGDDGTRVRRSAARCTVTYRGASRHSVTATYRPRRSARTVKASFGETVAPCGRSLTGCDLRHADLHRAWLVNADLSHADLRGADLRHAVLVSAQLRGAKLGGANLHAAILIETDLRHAQLPHADLVRTDLYRARAQGANLRASRLAHANLTGSNLRGANLKGTELTEVLWADTRCPDGSGSWHHGRTCDGHLLP